MTAEDDLKDVLLPDEHVLWTGRPQRVSRIALCYGLFAVVLICVVAAPLAQAALTGDMSIFESVNFTVNGEKLTQETPISDVYTSLIMIAVIFVTVVSAAILWALSSRRKSFALTDKRAIIKSHFPVSKASSIPLKNIFVVERSGGKRIGIIKLFPTDPNLLSRIMSLYQIPANSFSNIENPQVTEATILSAVAQSRMEQV
ncbi:hypothetical protein [Hyphococcus luteus]|uniref:DUF304 domain-containing protein n=1 Tax=Hyphococcus luteus TaxID=2058213 RepID=A0A2S7K832_9PROT|nr:hypothetical protein [Marinicaulis flavus]PQA88660.1 hypothetical protein CW354_10310 [Marinicaulis flavus]